VCQAVWGWRQCMWVDWGGLHCVGLVLLLQAAVSVRYLNPLTAVQYYGGKGRFLAAPPPQQQQGCVWTCMVCCKG
jgi:hypothetical protein